MEHKKLFENTLNLLKSVDSKESSIRAKEVDKMYKRE